MSFAPCVDLDWGVSSVIGDRSFHKNKFAVENLAYHFSKGMRESGMSPVAKHFPGHGDTQTDSHSALAMIPSDSSRLWSVELKPFKSLIDFGVDAIMVAHVHAPDYQPEANDPATLSKFWVNDILRKRLMKMVNK